MVCAAIALVASATHSARLVHATRGRKLTAPSALLSDARAATRLAPSRMSHRRTSVSRIARARGDGRRSAWHEGVTTTKSRNHHERLCAVPEPAAPLSSLLSLLRRRLCGALGRMGDAAGEVVDAAVPEGGGGRPRRGEHAAEDHWSVVLKKLAPQVHEREGERGRQRARAGLEGGPGWSPTPLSPGGGRCEKREGRSRRCAPAAPLSSPLLLSSLTFPSLVRRRAIKSVRHGSRRLSSASSSK